MTICKKSSITNYKWLFPSLYCKMRNMGGKDDPRNHPEARRLRILRRALGFAGSQGAFAAKMGWGQSEISLWENGRRRIARNKAITAHQRVPGLDPLWLTEGTMDFMTLPLRRAIEEAEKVEDAIDEEDLLSREG
jgi:transcriptional regulator with XRE-family HTH domain